MEAKQDVTQLATLALQAGNWAKYVSLVRDLDSSNDDEFLAGLAKQHPSVINLLDALSVVKEQDCFEVCTWLLPVVGHLSSFSLSDAKQLLEVAEVLDLAHRYVPAEQLSPHIVARPELGNELGEYLRSIDLLGDASAFVWAGAFAGAAPVVAATYLAKLLTGADIDTRLAAILTTCLPYRNEEVQKIVASFEPALAHSLAGSTETCRDVAWRALCRIASKSRAASNVLNGALNSGIPDASIAIANSLHLIDDPAANLVIGTSLEELINCLFQFCLSESETRRHVDAAIGSLFHRPLLRPIVTEATRKLGQFGNDMVELFPDVFNALANQRDEFATVLTDWLGSPDTCFDSLASLLSMCTHARAPIVLDEVAFAAQSGDQRTKAARRLLSLLHNGPTLCKFCALIAEMTALGPERFHLAGQMLDNVFMEYPAATEEFLKFKASTLADVPDAQIYRDIYANVLEWRGVLESLPIRKELLPTDSEMQVLRARKLRISREVMRMASERSFFAKFCSNVYVAQGKKFASHNAFGDPLITPMVETTHSVELPSSELADPMRGLIETNSLLRGAR
jgi:hypothetical protein